MASPARWLPAVLLAACGAATGLEDVDVAGGDADSDADADVDADADGDADLPEGCWTIQNLDVAGEGVEAQLPILGIAPDGASWIVQYGYSFDERLMELQVLDDATGVWRARTVESLITSGGEGGLSLGFDPDGALHFLALWADEFPDPPSLYGVPDGDGWSTSELASGIHDPSLAIDAEGTVRVAYHGDAGEFLGLATRLGDGSWQREILVEGSQVRNSSLAIAPDGAVHVAYLDGPMGEDAQVHHAWLGADGWRFESVDDASENAIADRWLSVDSRGVVHLAYPIRGAMRHASRADGDWQMEDGPPTVFSESYSMATSSDGTVHLAVAGDGLAWLGLTDEGWTSEVLARGFWVQWLPSLSVGPDGIPCIAYTYRAPPDNGETVLAHACRCAPP